MKNLDLARGWYETYVGMRLLEDRADQGYLVMGLHLEHHPHEDSLWVLEERSDIYPGTLYDGAARPNSVMHDKLQFAAYHQLLRDSGVKTAEILGYPPVEGFSWFHFYSPDGNRFDVVQY